MNGIARTLVLITVMIAAAAVGCSKKPPQEHVPETHTATKTDSNTQAVQNAPEEEPSASAADGADSGGLVNAPREAWTANLGGSAISTLHYIAITFLPDNTFIYRDACDVGCGEISNEEWNKVPGKTGKWHTDGNNLTMVFSDGYTVTAPYAVTDDVLTFDFGETGSDEILGLGYGVEGMFTKEKLYSQ